MAVEDVRFDMELQRSRAGQSFQPLEVTEAPIRFEGSEISEEGVMGVAVSLIGGELAQLADGVFADLDACRGCNHLAEKFGRELLRRWDELVGFGSAHAWSAGGGGL